ncbi:hypothetical protein C3L33_09070, partial [Rhododendron williamsianum]
MDQLSDDNGNKRTKHEVAEIKKIKGTVLLMKKNLLDVNDPKATLVDQFDEFRGQKVSLQLISAVNGDPGQLSAMFISKLHRICILFLFVSAAAAVSCILGKPAYLDWDMKITHITAADETFNVNFEWEEEVGVPGAFIVKNSHHNEFYLKTVTLEDVPGHGRIHFICNSWVYPAENYKKDRVFFTNQSYLPTKTPLPLRHYREEELQTLRGNGTGKLEEWDRVYDYDVYNDLSEPEMGPKHARPILGGSSEYPYPRRGRTGRPPAETEDKSAWSTDEEFAREMLAGLNPVVIRLLQEFPPNSKLNPKAYNDEASSKTKDCIEKNLEGLTLEEALKCNKLFALDYHDVLMPYLSRINSTSTKTYATRTLLFLKNDGTLKPLAIELSLPHPDGDQLGEVSEVYTPAEHGAEGTIWQLAKAYVAVNDSGYHQLICHWLHTHAVIEPFVIATNRQLSVLHPIHKLLHPHFRDTMNINALARQTLINSGGLLERTVFPAKYAMEWSAVAYKDWVFPEQALPADLIKRGVAVEDPKYPNGVRLLIKDYPYAVDGLEIWSAIKKWVEEYCSLYYSSDDMVEKDSELQLWWNEIREKGHGDKKNASWWPEMQNLKELVETCTTIIWIASALHAAVNFGQYPYGGYIPNRPAMSRRFIPKPGSLEYDELESNPDKAFLKTVTPQLQSILGISLIEILSRHTSDEVFLGQRDTPEWTADEETLDAFGRFGMKLAEIEEGIIALNSNENLKNRAGPAKMPYTLLFPSSNVGLTGKGIPNSVSI